jgi:hypothetical protein
MGEELHPHPAIFLKYASLCLYISYILYATRLLFVSKTFRVDFSGGIDGWFAGEAVFGLRATSTQSGRGEDCTHVPPPKLDQIGTHFFTYASADF